MRILPAVLVAVPCLLAACGSGSSPSGPSLDAAKMFSALSSGELGSFCDWVAQDEGGYGRTISCEATGSPLYTPSDQASCVTSFAQHARQPGCTGTVGDWTTCARWLDANWCSTIPATRPAVCDAIQAHCYGSGVTGDGGSD